MVYSLLEAWLRLVSLPGIGPVRGRQLLERCPLADLSQADVSMLRQLGLNEPQIAHWVSPDQHKLARVFSWLEQDGNRLLPFDDPLYPPMLRETVGAPLLLFVQGRCEALNVPLLAMVGTRQPTPGGRQAAQSLASALSDAGVGLCSGLALGIDGVAHQAALQAQGITVAVLGTGLAQVYPRRHVPLAQQIVAQGGALVSEFWPDDGVRAENFPRRNRIISGLSMGTLVVEAAEQSGSLITARFALEQGRELFAVPGSWMNPQAKGCHRLIQQGAKLVCTAADILEELGHFLGSQPRMTPRPITTAAPAHLPRDNLLDNVGYEATDIETIAALSRRPVELVMGQLIELELLGWIASVPGGYVRTRRD